MTQSQKHQTTTMLLFTIGIMATAIFFSFLISDAQAQAPTSTTNPPVTPEPPKDDDSDEPPTKKPRPTTVIAGTMEEISPPPIPDSTTYRGECSIHPMLTKCQKVKEGQVYVTVTNTLEITGKGECTITIKYLDDEGKPQEIKFEKIPVTKSYKGRPAIEHECSGMDIDEGLTFDWIRWPTGFVSLWIKDMIQIDDRINDGIMDTPIESGFGSEKNPPFTPQAGIQPAY